MRLSIFVVLKLYTCIYIIGIVDVCPFTLYGVRKNARDWDGIISNDDIINISDDEGDFK